MKKHKKKEKKTSSDLERALSTSTGESSSQPLGVEKQRSKSPTERDRNDEDGAPVVSYKTEAERRFEEARKKKVKSDLTTFTSYGVTC